MSRLGTPPVAVEVGADGTRLVLPGPDGRPEPVAVLPPGTSAPTAVDLLVGDCSDVLVVGVGISAAEAVVAGLAGPRLVVDAGRSGVSLSVVDDGCVRTTERLPVGGDRLDELVASAAGLSPGRARTVREALSVVERVDVPGAGSVEAGVVEAVLAPAWAGLADRAGALADGVVEVVLTGGVARTPLLAALLDERVTCPVRVLPEPDLAAVRCALRWWEDRRADGTVTTRWGDETATGAPPTDGGRSAAHGDGVTPARVVRSGEAGSGGRRTDGVRAGGVARGGDARTAPGHGAAQIGGLSARFRARCGGLPVAVVALGVVLIGAGTLVGAVPEAPAAAPGATLVQYGYATALPDGWEHTGGDPEHRRTLLTRTGSPTGVELISVERSPLGYDGAAEPERVRTELAAVFRHTDGVRDLRPDTVAGRGVIRYVQPAGPTAVVDWFVLVDGTDELVVGCRRPVAAPAPALERACTDVVRSARSN